ncbi:P-type conjugative transfer protein TrbL [Rhizobium sp.]|uniref:P-type conjugative transfer protein TrbL n=1 Tax=Rhizobium sp. TaxID=391 RepID=UPI0028A27E26
MRGATVLGLAVIAIAALGLTDAAFAQDGSVLTTLENSMSNAAKTWETRLMDGARSLFWILAGIEFGIAAIWLAIAAPSLDTWVAELIRRIMFIGFFLFLLQTGPEFAKAMVASLFEIGSGSAGSASPANTFNAGINVASELSNHIKVGLFEDNVGAIAAVFACILVIVSFSLVAAIFVSVLVEMYVGLLAGMIMLGLGGSSFTKDFAIKYLVYAFSVGMKLMALVMIAAIGSETLISFSQAPPAGDQQWLSSIIVGGLSVVVFIIAMYVPNIIQGVVQGVSVSNGMEAIRSGAQVTAFAASTAAGVGAGFAAAGAAKAAGAGLLGQASAGMKAGGSALAGTAAKAAMGSHGSDVGGSSRSMGLRNNKTSK